MLAPVPPEDLRSIFEEYLHGAITRGRIPPRHVGLGFDTLTVIDRIARQHPEADVELIADAYAAYAREHDPSGAGRRF
jgi:hypothetical protein